MENVPLIIFFDEFPRSFDVKILYEINQNLAGYNF